MSYSKIVKAVPGSGVHEYDQAYEAWKTNLDIGNGVCRALSVMWLRAKKENVDFWQKSGTVAEPLLAAANRLEKAVDLQAEYRRVSESRYVPDTATIDALAECGLTYRQGDVVASAQQGFAETSPNNEPAKICGQVLSARSRFFILSIKGSSGAHSIGIHRPYALIGKSSEMHLFDPNIGEFKVSGVDKGISLLEALNTSGYADARINLNKQYILWSFAS